jgi:hypothetical protein
MTSWASTAALFLMLFQAAQPAPRATVSPQTFVGTWVGTQSWAIQNPPPGARPDQPVTLTIDLMDGKLVGSMVPFMGGQDGATFVESKIVGEELQVSAVVGRPRPATLAPPPPANGDEGPQAPAPAGRGRGGRRGAQPPSWKDTAKIQFAFKNDGVNLTGTADVMLGDVKWLKFNYDLSKKRSRY